MASCLRSVLQGKERKGKTETDQAGLLSAKPPGRIGVIIHCYDHAGLWLSGTLSALRPSRKWHDQRNCLHPSPNLEQAKPLLTPATTVRRSETKWKRAPPPGEEIDSLLSLR